MISLHNHIVQGIKDTAEKHGLIKKWVFIKLGYFYPDNCIFWVVRKSNISATAIFITSVREEKVFWELPYLRLWKCIGTKSCDTTYHLKPSFKDKLGYQTNPKVPRNQAKEIQSKSPNLVPWDTVPKWWDMWQPLVTGMKRTYFKATCIVLCFRWFSFTTPGSLHLA